MYYVDKVEIYSTAVCNYCNMAKRVFKQKEWQYEEKFLDKEPALREELQQRLGESPRTVPQIFINNEYVGGYDKLVEWIDTHQI